MSFRLGNISRFHIAFVCGRWGYFLHVTKKYETIFHRHRLKMG